MHTSPFPRAALLALLACALIAPPVAHADGVSDAEYKEIVTEFKRLWATKNSLSHQLRAVDMLGKADDVRATKMLWAILMKHQGGDWAARQVWKYGTRSLRHLEGDKSLSYIFKKVAGRMHPTRRADVLLALVRIKNPMVLDKLVELSKNKSPLARIAAFDALGHIRHDKAVAAVVAGLKDKSYWQVRYSAMMSAVRLKAKPAVPIMISMLSVETARMQHDLLRALEALTKASFRNVAAWQEWWKANEKNRLMGGGMSAYKKLIGSTAETGEAPSRPNRDGTTELDLPTFYGVKVTASRLVFVIDTSGSMLEKYRGNRPPIDKISVVISGAKDDPDSRRRVTLDWSKIKTHWDLAREQLIFTLKMLPDTTHFTIIRFDSKVRAWKKKTVAATPEAKSQALKWLGKIKPEGETDLFGSLEKAFSVNGGKDPLASALFDNGVEQIFLLTDGAPTVGKYLMERTAEVSEMTWVPRFRWAIDDWNRMRKVEINTVGMGDSSEMLMAGLAKDSGGKYSTPGLRR